jgi:hypothetical protein
MDDESHKRGAYRGTPSALFFAGLAIYRIEILSFCTKLVNKCVGSCRENNFRKKKH